MSEVILEAPEGAVVPVHALAEAETQGFLEGRQPFVRAFASLSDFKGKAGQVLVVPDTEGAPQRVLFGLGKTPDAQTFRVLAAKLPADTYRIVQAPPALSARDMTLAFVLGSYRFDRYKPSDKPRPRLVAPDGVDVAEVRHIAHACALARDMVNTPANDLGPLQVETIAREIAEQHGATITVITGEGLIEANYPAIHAVGRAAAADRAPRLIEMSWGDADAPVVAVIGKGVTFDTGGLDIKPSSGMRLMKKDMGGAAHALALGRMIMAQALPVRLVVLVPVAENAISGDAMRPGDVIASRAGLSIEIGNTDAEGRLILADALTRAAELEPVLTLDLATLTGAARVALGPELPPYYTADETLAADIASHAQASGDPVWRMPLWAGYDEAVDGDLADLRNDPEGWAQAGSITAALFLQRFAPKTGAWAHFDIYAWNSRNRPGYASGGEAQAIRGLYALIKARFS